MLVATSIRIRSIALAAASVAVIATPLSAQYLGGGTKTAEEAQLANLEQLSDKFLALAGAFPEEAWEWRPMEGVRSVHEVMSLIAAEGTLFPTAWGFDKPDWTADGGFGPELGRLAALSGEDVIAEIDRSFAHLIALARGLSEEDRAKEVNFFGLTVDVGTALTLMSNDMHEHLGQSIAYARMNRIVPPWSAPAGEGEAGEDG
ncbi:MAG: DinB family protein [Gemmatimonadota bacterium]